jgi:hypothetical protein
MEPKAPDRWRATLNAARTVARFCDEKIGWNRIGVLLSVAIITIAAVVLYHILHDIEIREVIGAIRTTDKHRIALAALFVGLAYFTLTFYDLFALRTIGRSDVPYRVAALAGFTSYSVGHNIGATVFTGGAVRYRIYSASGLDAIEVAKICFVAGLTFWLGNAAVLGLGVTYHPLAASAIDQLPGWVNRGIGIAILIVLASYIGWVWRAKRMLGRGGWQVRLPNGPSTLLQICIGIVDLSCCALAMYMVLPDEPNIGFVSLAVIFVTATMLGFASHAPGGLGVFDATMLVALWQFDKEDLLAGLLLFRLLYYIMPFVVALVMLGVREAIIYMRTPGPLPPPRTVETSGPLKSELERKDKSKR